MLNWSKPYQRAVPVHMGQDKSQSHPLLNINANISAPGKP